MLGIKEVWKHPKAWGLSSGLFHNRERHTDPNDQELLQIAADVLLFEG